MNLDFFFDEEGDVISLKTITVLKRNRRQSSINNTTKDMARRYFLQNKKPKIAYSVQDEESKD